MKWVVEYYEQAELPDLNQAFDYWKDYKDTYKISLEVSELEEQS